MDQWREDITRALPWVRELKPKEIGRCEGFRSGRPLKALFGTDEQRAEAAVKYRCKKNARWRFRALKTKPWRGVDGRYCTHHLFTQFGYTDENVRLHRWLDRHVDPETKELKTND